MKKILYLCVISMLCLFMFSGCENDKTPPGTGGGADEPAFNVNTSSITINAYKGYTVAPSRSVQVNNTGNTTLTVNITKDGTNPDDFNLSPVSLVINAGANKPVTISPVVGLDTGSYSTILTFSAEGLESKTKTVNFSVEDPVPETHIYIAFGQSNMQGPGDAETQDQSNVPERFKTLNVVAGQYAYGTGANSGNRDKGKWYTAVPPNILTGTNPRSGDNQHRVGLSPMDYFGRTMVANTPDHITIGVVAVAHGDLALASFHKTRAADYFSGTTPGGTGKESTRPSSTERTGHTRYTGAGYTNMFDAIVTNVKIAQAEGGIVKGIIFHQGESGRGLTYTTWELMLKEIYDDLLDDLDLEPDSIPILCGQLIHGGTGPNGVLENEDTLRTGTGLSNAHLILTGPPDNDLPDRGDTLHFSTQSIRDLGRRYANKMLELVYGITPSED